MVKLTNVLQWLSGLPADMNPKRYSAIASHVEARVGKIPLSGRYFQAPRKIEDDYVMMSDILGSGANGNVIVATSKASPGDTVAVKTLQLKNKSADEILMIKAEVQNYLCLDHPHIARLHAVYETDQQIHLVMERLEGGELFDKVREKRFSEDEARDAIRQMLLALNYMHSHGIVHRDVKFENFVYDKIDGQHLKLIDFGFSTRWSPKSKHTMTRFCGTLSYSAPEVFDNNYTSQCDLWSLGVIGFGLLSGGMPFSGSSAEQRRKIQAGEYTMKPERWNDISSEAKDFIQLLLKVDPASRLSTQQALEHPWIATAPTVLQSSRAQAAQSLYKFSRISKFRRNCMRMLAWSLPQEDLANSYSLFLSLDKNQTGTISLSELRSLMTEEMQINNESVIMQIFEALDYNQDQEIHYSDFLAAMLGTVIDFRDSSLRTLFRAFDRDGTGCVTADDLRDVLSVADGKLAHAYIQLADPQNNGHISLIDFSNHVKYMSRQSTSESTVCICSSTESDSVCICKAPEPTEQIGSADVANDTQNEEHYDNFNAIDEPPYEKLKGAPPIHGNTETKRESLVAFVHLVALM